MMVNDKVIEVLHTNYYQILCEQNNVRKLDYAQEFTGLRLPQNQIVSIKVSNPDMMSYKIIKYECKILEKLKGFSSILQYIDSIDLECEKVFILVVEYHDKSLENYINNQFAGGRNFSIEEVTKISFSLLNSLFELHSKEITHFNINPNSILIDQDGNCKFRDFIPLSYYDNYSCQDNIQQSDYRYPYHSPQIKSKIQQGNDVIDKDISFSSDVYSLGIVLLRLIGLEINNKTIDLITKQGISDVVNLINSDLINFFSFLKNYILQEKQELRYSVFQLKRIIFKFYEKYIDKESLISKVNKLISLYAEQNLPADAYLVFLYSSLIQYNPSIKIEEKLLKAFNQLSSIVKEKSNFLLLHEVGSFYYESDQNEKCLEYFLQTLEIRKAIYGEEHLLTAESINNIGNCYYYLNDYHKSLKYYKEALTIRLNLFGENHTSISECLTNIADSYRGLNDLDLSIQQNQRSLNIINSLFQGSHYSKIFPHICMAQVYRKQEDHQKSLEYHLQVLKIREDIYSTGHQAIAITLRSIGLSYKYLNNYNKSLEYHTKSLEMKKILYKKDHQYIANSLYDIADCYRGLNNPEKEFYYRAQHLKMLYKINKTKIKPFNYYLMNLNIDHIFDNDTKLEFYIRLVRILQTNLKGDNHFMKDTINLIINLANSLEYFELSEYYEIKLVQMSSYF